MTTDVALLLGFLVAMLAMSLWAASRLPPLSHETERREADRLLDSQGWRWFVLLLQPVNWLLLDGVVLLSEWSVHAQASEGTHIGQILGGLAVTTTHAALILILLRWARR